LIKPLSKFFAFTIAFMNIFFYYIWGAIFYISALVSHIFSYIPFLSFIGALFSFIGGVVGRIIIYIWMGFDYIIMFLRELVMPLLVSIFTFLKKVFLWIWTKILWFIRLFIPACKPSKKHCLKFDKKSSYGISLLQGSDIDEQNRLYEASIREHYQTKLTELYSKEKIDLVKVYNKAYKSRRNSDMFIYNTLLNEMQVSELNIQNNYHMSLDQHRMILFRNNSSAIFTTYIPLHTQALHLSPVNDKVVI